MKHKLSLKNRPFYNILNGTKTLEGRLFKSKYKRIKPGNIIVFSNDENSFEKRKLNVNVKNVYYYKNFKVAFKQNSFAQAIPGMSLTEVLEIYKHIYGQKQIDKFGVVLIRFQLIDT